DDPPNIAAVGSGFTSKAGSIGAKRNGQGVGVESFIPKEIGHGHLRRRNEPQVVPAAPKKVLSKFRQLSRSIEAGGVNEKRRQNLLISMLLRVQIEHEVNQRPL